VHEWALAESVISTAGSQAQKAGLSNITAVKISLGELQQIEKDIFLFALRQLAAGMKKPFSDTQFDIQSQRAVLRCRVCGHQWCFQSDGADLTEEAKESVHFLPEVSHSFLRCPGCNSPDFEIVGGRGVWIESIEGEK